MRKGAEDAAQVASRVRRREAASRELVGKVAVLKVRHDNVNLAVDTVTVDQVHDVLAVAEGAQAHDFVADARR